MKKSLFFTLTVLIAFTLHSCIWLGYYKELSAGYALHALETNNRVSLVYKDGEANIGLVNESVVAYINHADFIAVIRQEPGQSNNVEIMGETGEYYLVPLKKKISENYSMNLIGPMNRGAYLKLLLELGLAESTEFVFLKL